MSPASSLCRRPSLAPDPGWPRTTRRLRRSATPEISQLRSGWFSRGKTIGVLKGRGMPRFIFHRPFRTDLISDGQPGTLCRANFRCTFGTKIEQLVTDFHFQPGVAAFGRKPHSSFFPKPCASASRPFGARLVPSRSTSANKHRLIIFTVHPIPTLRVETTRAPERRRRGIFVAQKTQIHLQPQQGGIFRLVGVHASACPPPAQAEA